jgi:ligand-binding SRPBCC domain-containing protein
MSLPLIHLTTFIEAPADRVFDLSRSITLHKKSMEHTQEVAVAGTVTGLLGLDESVTWKAKHLGKHRTLKVKITQMLKPFSFTDEMMEGSFRSMKHEHHFKEVANGTIMIDLFNYEIPYGRLGKLFNRLYLSKYIRRLLEQRNQVIKDYAESNKWQHLLR